MINNIVIKDDYCIMYINSKHGDFECYFDTDFLELVDSYKWHVKKDKKTYYCSANSIDSDGKKTTINLHRLISKCPKNLQVDHRDRNGLNNRLSNLRNVSNILNARNLGNQRNKKDQHLPPGIHEDRNGNRFVASWNNDNFKQKTRKFNINKYGRDLALKLAVITRYRKAKKYNYITSEIEEFARINNINLKPKIKIKRLRK